MESTIEEWLLKKYEDLVCRITREPKEDLNLSNHLLGHRRLYPQLHVRNDLNLPTVGREIMPLVLANSGNLNACRGCSSNRRQCKHVNRSRV